jgi:hypothetical protein
MMPTIDWAYLCDYAYTDASGKTSIVGMFENYSVQSLPATLNQLFIILKMKLAPTDEFQIAIGITSPSGEHVTPLSQQKVIAGGMERGVVIFGFYLIKFSEIDEHHIEIFLNGVSVHHIPLNVILIQR